MNSKVLTMAFVLAFSTAAFSAEVEKVPIAELDDVVIKQKGLLLNNFNFLIEEAWMGGLKATAQVTGKNKSDYDINYTVYMAAYSAGGTLIACFALEPLMNIHEAGKLETLEASGMVESEAKGKVDHILLSVVLQAQ